jgi:hypothetical protein
MENRIILTNEQFERALEEAYRQGRKDAMEEIEIECICILDKNGFVEISNPRCEDHNCCKGCSKSKKTILSSDGFWKCVECNK